MLKSCNRFRVFNFEIVFALCYFLIISFHVIENEDFQLNYKSSDLHIINNGHFIEVEYQDGSYINYQSDDYHLIQFHFHAPSEHSIDGKYYPMEMHLVHKNKNGKADVITS